nr:lipoyl domain-containing protein [Sphingomonas sp. Y57]
MRTSVNLPKGGMGIDEATVVAWLRSEGDRVEAGEPIVEVETAKATQEVEAPVSGILVLIKAQPGDEVMVNSSLGEIEHDDG